MSFVTLKSLIPRPYDFEPQTSGDHIGKRRLILGITQEPAATRFGVKLWDTLRNSVRETLGHPSKLSHRFPFSRFLDAFAKARDTTRSAKVMVAFDG